MTDRLPKLSKREKDILIALANLRLSYSIEDCKKNLEKWSLKAAPLLMQLRKMPKLTTTEDDATKEYYTQISKTTKDLIIWQNKLDVSTFYDKYGFNPDSPKAYGVRADYRCNISLPELIAQKLFPKGRNYRYRFLSWQTPDYNESLKKANSIMASYTRMLKRLVDLGLLGTRNEYYMAISGRTKHTKAKRYYVTEKALSILNTVGLLNTSNFSATIMEAS